MKRALQLSYRDASHDEGQLILDVVIRVPEPTGTNLGIEVVGTDNEQLAHLIYGAVHDGIGLLGRALPTGGLHVTISLISDSGTLIGEQGEGILRALVQGAMVAIWGHS